MSDVDEDPVEGGGAELPELTSQVLDEEADLLAGMTGLSELVAGSLSLEQLLTHIAEFAVTAIPGADGAGVTMFDNGSGNTIVASAPFVRDVDDIQYGLGEGPCISAAEQRRTIRSGSLGGERSWPRFGPRVGRLGVHSALSLPLLVGDAVVGSINVYATPKTPSMPALSSSASCSPSPRPSRCTTLRSWPRRSA